MNNWITSNDIYITRVLGGRCNVFLAAQAGRYLLVDTSVANRMKTLISRLESLGVNATNLAALILTHAHFDHAENAAAIKDKFKTMVFAHTAEADYLKKGESIPIKGALPINRRAVDLLGPKILSHAQYHPVEPDILVNDRYDLSPLGFDAYLLHTPGHSPGSLSVIVDGNVALVGDAMYGIFAAVYPPFALDPGLMVAGWKKLLDTGCCWFLPGHGGAISRERVQAQYRKYVVKL